MKMSNYAGEDVQYDTLTCNPPAIKTSFIGSLTVSLVFAVVPTIMKQAAPWCNAMSDIDVGSCQSPVVACMNWAAARSSCQRNLRVDVRSTLGRFLSPTCVDFVARQMPPLTQLDSETRRRTVACCGGVKAGSGPVPTPVQADRLFVLPGVEQKITVCCNSENRSDLASEMQVMKLILAAKVSQTSDSCSHSELMSNRPSETLQNNAITSRTLSTAVSDDSRQQDAVAQVPLDAALRGLELPRAGQRGPFGSKLTSIPDQYRPSVADRRPPMTTRCSRLAALKPGGIEVNARYWERRRKNNEAAKRSRDIRRANERRVALQALMLEQENSRLRSEVATLTDDMLRLYNYLLVSRTFACVHCRRTSQ